MRNERSASFESVFRPQFLSDYIESNQTHTPIYDNLMLDNPRNTAGSLRRSTAVENLQEIPTETPLQVHLYMQIRDLREGSGYQPVGTVPLTVDPLWRVSEIKNQIRPFLGLREYHSDFFTIDFNGIILQDMERWYKYSVAEREILQVTIGCNLSLSATPNKQKRKADTNDMDSARMVRRFSEDCLSQGYQMDF